MTVTLNSAGGSSVPNWQLVTSSAPTGVSTVTYSGLSGYSKYRILAVGLVAASGTSVIRINGDSGTNYAYTDLRDYTTGTPPNPTQIEFVGAATGIPMSNLAGVAPTYDIQIDNALLAAPKSIVGWGTDVTSVVGSWSGLQGPVQGLYGTSSVLTSISIVRTANFTSGTIYILGAN